MVFKSFILIIGCIAIANLATADDDKKRIGDTILFKGNYFEVSSAVETLMVEDPITKEVELVVANPNPIPTKMNGLTIYTKDEIDTPPSLTVLKLKRYLIYQLGRTLTQLGDGMYRMYIDNVILDEKGKIVYYDFGGLQRADKPQPVSNKKSKSSIRVSIKLDFQNIPPAQQKKIETELSQIVDKAPAYTPAKAYGTPVIYRMKLAGFPQFFEIEGGVPIIK